MTARQLPTAPTREYGAPYLPITSTRSTSMFTARPSRASFDPKCTVWTPFAALQVGDRVDYWGAARPITEFQAFDDGRVRVLVDNGIGQDLALVPGSEEYTWRERREEEYLEAARKVVKAAVEEAFGHEAPACCGHMTCDGEEACGYIIVAAVDGSVRCDCQGRKANAGQ